MSVTIDAVDKRSRWVSATVTTEQGTKHRLGHIPAEGGWFCTCPRGKSCTQIAKVKDLVPPMGDTDVRST